MTRARCPYFLSATTAALAWENQDPHSPGFQTTRAYTDVTSRPLVQRFCPPCGCCPGTTDKLCKALGERICLGVGGDPETPTARGQGWGCDGWDPLSRGFH